MDEENLFLYIYVVLKWSTENMLQTYLLDLLV